MIDLNGVLRLEHGGEFAAALSTVEALLRDNPAAPQPLLYARARLLIKLGRYQEAAAALDVADGDRPSSGAMILRGRLGERSGELEASHEAWRSVLALDDKNPEAICSLGRVLVKLGRVSEAQEHLERSGVVVGQDVTTDVVWGRLLTKSGALEEALCCWRHVLAKEPDHREGMRMVELLEARVASGAIGRELDPSNSADAHIINPVREAIVRKLGSGDEAVLSRGQRDYVNRHTYIRYNRSIASIVPWIAGTIDLPSSEIVEIGCGTGSTTAALAQNSEFVFGYDIDARTLDTARVRLGVLGIQNVELFECEAARLQADMVLRHGSRGVDVIVMYALIEHLTVEERLEALRSAWKVLKPGGVLAIVEAPNRLTYFDWHTSQLPFFHMLPLELQVHYYQHSPREDYVASMDSAIDSGRIAESLVRYGQSVSYHEFEIALGNLEPLIVADGRHPLVDSRKSMMERRAESYLDSYVRDHGLDVHPAFVQANINVVFRKPT